MPNNKGQSLFEVVVAIGIIALILISVVSLSVTSIRNSNYSKNKTSANRYAQEVIEWIREEKEGGYGALEDLLIGGGPTVWCLKTDPLDFNDSGVCTSGEKMVNDKLFYRELQAEAKDINGQTAILVTANVRWRSSNGEHVISIKTTLADI